jgi:hypothetical protein
MQVWPQALCYMKQPAKENNSICFTASVLFVSSVVK